MNTEVMTALSSAALAAAVGLVVRPGRRATLPALAPRSVSMTTSLAGISTGSVPWALAAASVVWLLGLGGLAALVVWAVTAAVLRGRARAAAQRAGRDREACAVEACGVLSDELRAGRVPGEALASASEVDPLLVSVSRVAEGGGDVPGAFRATEVRGYVVIAAAWQVAEQHGAGLGEALRRVLRQLRADRATARVVAAELASARSTATLLAALPAFATVAGAASGGRPWEFLLGTPIGACCLVLGLTLGWAGLRWIDAIAVGVTGRT